MYNLYLAIPNTGEIRAETVLWTHTVVQDLSCLGIQVSLDFSAAKPCPNNRNRMGAEFLDSSAEWMLMCDHDNPPRGNPVRKVDEWEQPCVIGYPTPILVNARPENQGDGMFAWNGGHFGPDRKWTPHYPATADVEEVDGVGGCLMIHREVLEKTPRPWWQNVYDENGYLEYSDDFYFCLKAREAGFRVFCDYSLPCSHFQPIDMLRIIQAGVVTDGRAEVTS